MQPSYWFCLLFIALVLARTAFAPVRLTRVQMRNVAVVGLFWIYCMASLLFPIIQDIFGIAPKLVNSSLLLDQRPYGFHNYSLSQFAYLTFFLLISLCIMLEVREWTVLKNAIAVLLGSTVLTVAWGICVQYSSFFFGFDYPDWLFNNNPGYDQGFGSRFSVIPRLTSVAPEASMFGYFLAMMIGLLYALNIGKSYVFGARFQKGTLVLLFAAALISTSTTAYTGIVLVVGAVPFIILYARNPSLASVRRALTIELKYILYIGGGLAVLAAALLLANPGAELDNLVDILMRVTVWKSEGGSGRDRFDAFQRGVEIMLETGLLGAGWGNNATFDLFSTLLANVGVPGTGLFLGMFWLASSNAWRAWRRRCADSEAMLIPGLVLSIAIGLCLMLLAIPGFIFTGFWVMFGMVLAAPAIAKRGPARSVPRTQTLAPGRGPHACNP